MNQVAEFEEAPRNHCREASRIVETVFSRWFSKHRLEEGGTISRESADGFAAFALKKRKTNSKPELAPMQPECMIRCGGSTQKSTPKLNARPRENREATGVILRGAHDHER